MPWLAVEKEYAFAGPDGTVSLFDLFQGRRQLIVYRAFFEPGVHGWPDQRVPGLLDGCRPGRPRGASQRDATPHSVSRCACRSRHRASEGAHGLGEHPVVHAHGRLRRGLRCRRVARYDAFIRDDDGGVFRTYYINSRGDEVMGGTWSYLDTRPRSGARRNGRKRRRATPRPRRTRGGGGTTNTPRSRPWRGTRKSTVASAPSALGLTIHALRA